jgi:acyl-CoA reductase-like NAD-dependent aldehyde dehydrogenase
MEVTLVADGHPDVNGMGMLMHNDRLSDPLDTITRAIGRLTSKSKKTLANHEDISYLEWHGGLYTTERIEASEKGDLVIPPGVVATIPAWNMVRCLQEGATRHKRGKDVPRGVHPLAQFATLTYDGPDEIEQLWKSGGFFLRKPVGVRGKRTPRTRPLFMPWRASLRVEVDSVVFDIDTLSSLWADAGRYAGLGDMRPIYGRFEARIEDAA